MSAWTSRERASRYMRCVLGKCLLILIVLPVLFLAFSRLYVPALAQQKEPSPIEVELIAPEQAGPGTVIEVLIKYDAVDLNAGANLNYNIFGPVRILTRDPEPPNPAYNIWIPTEETTQGTIKIRMQVNDGTDGQTLVHQAEVRWGDKVVNWSVQTLVKPLPPAPTATPRPRPQQAAPTVAPTATLSPEPAPAGAAIELDEVIFLDQAGQPLLDAQANQEIALQAMYASASDAQNVTAEIWFEPDVVNLDLPRDGVRYVYAISALPAAPERASLFEPALKGRIRSYEEGGRGYPVRAIVRLVPNSELAGGQAQELSSAPLDVRQPLSLKVSASTEAKAVRAGESLIVHARVENPSSVAASQVRLALSELPTGFVVSPIEQTIDQTAANGGTENRVFTIRSEKDFDGQITFYVVATDGEMVVESEPVQIQVNAAKPLLLAVSTSATALYAGDALYVDVSATNESEFEAKNVTAKLIDVSGNLGVLVQEVGDIGPTSSREWVFVVQVPEDFPADTTATLVVQTISENGITSQSSEIEIAVACRPRVQVFVEPPAGRLAGGDSVEAIALVKNESQCTASRVSVSLAGLPASFAEPPAQEIAELAPGEARYLTFHILVPRGHRGEVVMLGQVVTEQGAKAQSSPVRIAAGGVSPVISIVFGLLILVVAITGIVGMVLYFRNR